MLQITHRRAREDLVSLFIVHTSINRTRKIEHVKSLQVWSLPFQVHTRSVDEHQARKEHETSKGKKTEAKGIWTDVNIKSYLQVFLQPNLKSQKEKKNPPFLHSLPCLTPAPSPLPLSSVSLLPTGRSDDKIRKIREERGESLT